MRRGEVWWADFGVPFGSEPGYRPPVIVVQADDFNKLTVSDRRRLIERIGALPGLALGRLGEGLRQVLGL